MENLHNWAKKYPARLLDSELNLKPSWPWLLVLTILTLPTWYGLGVVAARVSQGEWLPWIGYHDLTDYLISFAEQLPAVIVLIALFRRSAKSSHFIRWLWRHHHKLLLLAATGQIVHRVIFLSVGHQTASLPVVIKLVIFSWVLLYLIKSRFAHDFPKSFPLPD